MLYVNKVRVSLVRILAEHDNKFTKYQFGLRGNSSFVAERVLKYWLE